MNENPACRRALRCLYAVFTITCVFHATAAAAAARTCVKYTIITIRKSRGRWWCWRARKRRRRRRVVGYVANDTTWADEENASPCSSAGPCRREERADARTSFFAARAVSAARRARFVSERAFGAPFFTVACQ